MNTTIYGGIYQSVHACWAADKAIRGTPVETEREDEKA